MREFFIKLFSSTRDRGRARPGGLCGLLIGLALFPFEAQSQLASPFGEVGRFYVQNFGPEDYDAHAQNWAIVQSPEGLLYVGNNEGVLEYDGVSWRVIPVANRSVVRSLAVDAEGRIVVGATDELGYLAPGALDGMRYVSLVDHIPPDDRTFGSVWNVVRTSGGLYFQTWDRLFRWDGSRMKVWRTESAETWFDNSFVAEDTFYVQKRDIGWMRIDGDALVMAPGGESFPGRVSTVVPQGKGALLFISRDQGIFRCVMERSAGEPCAPFSPGLTDLLTTLDVYRATMLPEGNLAIGTTRGGVVLLDPAGRLLRILNEASGLRDEYVTCTYADRQGGLWLCLNNGLARVELGAAVSYYDKTMGLSGNVLGVARHRGRLYAATSLGVYRLEPASGGAEPRFSPRPGLAERCWRLLSTAQGLLATCHDGVYDVEAQERIASFGMPVLAVARSRRDPTLLYLGLDGGLARMSLDGGRWTVAGNVDGVRAYASSIAEDDQGRLWIGTKNEGVLRLDPAGKLSDQAAVSRPVVTQFGTGRGLPPGQVDAQTIAGRVVFASREGLFRLADTVADGVRFVPDTEFDGFQPPGSRRGFRMDEDDQGRVWIAGGEASAVGQPQPDGGYAWQSTALRLAPMRDVFAVRAEAKGALWVGGPHGLIRLDTTRLAAPSARFPVWIRRITAAAEGEAQSPSGGVQAETSSGWVQTEASPDGRTISWPYRDNALRFTFAAPLYDAPGSTRYRTRLGGFEDNWSTWSHETDKDYTNLWEGRYVFHVQACDVYGNLSREDSVSFRILPPWYRTWWAFALYGLALAGVLAAFVRAHREELRREREKAERERQISLRLREVDKMKDEFLADTERLLAERERLIGQLEARNAELARFNYTVAHDLKNPLTTIRNFIGVLERDVAAGDHGSLRRDLRNIDDAASTLHRLLKGLYEYSQIGYVAMPCEEVALAGLVRHAVAELAPVIAERGIAIEVAADLPVVCGDRARLLEAVRHLLSNAFQYLGNQPAPRVEVSTRQDGPEAVIFVRDNGRGIDSKFHEKVFGLFERLDPEGPESTGIGLALVKRIVEVHGGRIWVESKGRNQGATFCFTLPRSMGDSFPSRRRSQV